MFENVVHRFARGMKLVQRGVIPFSEGLDMAFAAFRDARYSAIYAASLLADDERKATLDAAVADSQATASCLVEPAGGMPEPNVAARNLRHRVTCYI